MVSHHIDLFDYLYGCIFYLSVLAYNIIMLILIEYNCPTTLPLSRTCQYLQVSIIVPNNIEHPANNVSFNMKNSKDLSLQHLFSCFYLNLTMFGMNEVSFFYRPIETSYIIFGKLRFYAKRSFSFIISSKEFFQVFTR